MSLIQFFPKPLMSIILSCCQCGKRISKDTLHCESCNLQHVMDEVMG